MIRRHLSSLPWSVTAKLYKNLYLRSACGSWLSPYSTAGNYEVENFRGIVAVFESFLCKIWGCGICWWHRQAISKVFSAKIAFSPICESIIENIRNDDLRQMIIGVSGMNPTIVVKPENCLYNIYIWYVCIPYMHFRPNCVHNQIFPHYHAGCSYDEICGKTMEEKLRCRPRQGL